MNAQNLSSMRTLLLALPFLPLTALGQNWGIGFRLGDPSGLSIKKYAGDHAFELSVGRTHLFDRNNYYYDRYDRWYGDQNFNHKEHQLVSYSHGRAVGIQFHYLVHKDVKNATGLRWYFGAGGQVRLMRYRYDYRYKLENGPDWIVVSDQRVTETDFGVDGVLGLEYKFRDAPVSLFLDGTLFMEIVDDPFIFTPQFGIGARYTF